LIRDRFRSEAGFSLAETIVTVAIVSIGFVAILTAMQVTVTVSAAHRTASVADTILRSSAELVKDPTASPYANCATASSYPLNSISVPSGYTATITEVRYWSGAIPTGSAYAPVFSATCPATDQGLQRITLSVTATDGTVQRVQIVKRKPG
jgi:Tfp pilus assembly protein PilV